MCALSDQKPDSVTLRDPNCSTNSLRFNEIERLRKDIGGHKREIHEREITIRDKDRRIYDLKKKNQELEKFKFVLDYKIKELKRQLNPRGEEIRELKKQVFFCFFSSFFVFVSFFVVVFVVVTTNPKSLSHWHAS